ncbi:hypothetical protein [Thalassobacillus devorans]|nr:hypothetical protein [Thalassobacillus devorans]
MYGNFIVYKTKDRQSGNKYDLRDKIEGLLDKLEDLLDKLEDLLELKGAY